MITQRGSNQANRHPVANKDQVTVRAGSVTTIPVLANDSDPDGGKPRLFQSDLSNEQDLDVWVAGDTLRLRAPDKPGSLLGDLRRPRHRRPQGDRRGEHLRRRRLGEEQPPAPAAADHRPGDRRTSQGDLRRPHRGRPGRRLGRVPQHPDRALAGPRPRHRRGLDPLRGLRGQGRHGLLPDPRPGQVRRHRRRRGPGRRGRGGEGEPAAGRARRQRAGPAEPDDLLQRARQ
ncbi:hypothetical protein G5V59_07850 [Nocardioides sp. W3-2-3]|nr:hypothetical protein [Nocardioides convexus]